MKQYIIVKRALKTIASDLVTFKIYTEENKHKALEIVNSYNTHNNPDPLYEYELVELVPVIQILDSDDMTDEEIKERNDTINNIYNDLRKDIIEYDEWAAIEYDEIKVDHYGTAVNLYNAGYRKITKVEE